MRRINTQETVIKLREEFLFKAFLASSLDSTGMPWKQCLSPRKYLLEVGEPKVLSDPFLLLSS